MPPKKTGNQQSVKVLIERINVLTENFRSRPTNTGAIKRPATSPDPPSPPKAVRFVEPTIPDAPRIASDDLADNPYAQEIFMYKTNVHDVVTRIVLARDGEEGMERRVRKFKRKLYRMFANEPKNRIRYPLDLVRFESSYYEYRFFLALHKPLHSDEQYQDYKEQLVAAGIAESWVTMRKNNRLLVYEDRIVQKLKGKFKEWSLKLDKLDYYLMDMHSKQPVPKVPKVVEATTETVVSTTSESEDNLLEQILKHSNAKERFTSHQIRALFPHILRSLEQSDDMQWLIFENDELNKRFKLGDYAPIVPQEAEEVVNVPEVESQAESVASNSRSSSVASPDSEIAQMRSEMAMTQPRELIQLESSRFVDTQALVNALEQHENLAASEIQQQVEEVVEPIVAEQVQHELSPMITPAQVEVIEISDSPMHEEDEIQIKEEFLYTLDYFRKFTNIEQYIMHEIKQKHPKTYEKKLSKLDQYVERYYKSAMPLLLKNQLPPNLRLLSRKERKQRQASMVETGQRLNTSGASSVISELPPPTTQSEEVSPITETPFVPRVPRKARLIVYEEDEDDIPTQPNLPADTLPMPNTEDFLPPVCSTQLPCESLASPPRRRDTPCNSPSVSIVPNQSPSRLAPAINDSPIALPPIVVPTETLPVPTLHNIHPPRYSTHHPNESEAIPLNRQDTPLNSALRLSTSSSHVPTPAFDSSSSMDGTVIVNTKSPRKDTSIKRELNTTSYEDEVEFVEVPNRSILIEDSIELLPGALLERQPSNSYLAAFPDNLRGMVSTLFRETRDTTLSQGSGASSSGSGEAPAETQPMGFHQSSETPSSTTLQEDQGLTSSGDSDTESHNQAALVFPAGQMKLPLSFKSTKVESHLTELCHRLSTLQPFRLMSNSFQLPSLPPSATTIRFLTRSEIASVKFCRNPSVHRQRHHLAVTLNHREDGIFRLTVADHEVRKLLNLTGGDRGWQALVSTLNRTNRFEYDRFRPASAFQFHQMSISEKILYQFFATSPECGQGPGWVLRFDDVRNYCEGDGVRLEEFNCFRHTYGGGFSKANASDIDLSEGLDPAIVQRMKEIKRNASHMHQI